ncbi:MAG: hypothetical protein NTW50_00630 [Candidatus Berkelbacteria bacterium]|nr:hypothetical protein [Candidatus Berkelbacteria bacterium]
MNKIKFDYNLDKDAWSWVLIAKDKELWGLDWENEVAHIPTILLNKISESNHETAQDIVVSYIKDNPKTEYKNEIIKIQIPALQSAWEIIGNKYFKNLENLIQKPIYTEDFGCFFTSGFMCPYNEKGNWFMVSMWHSLPQQIATICHELMHLQFLHYYKKYLEDKGLSDNQIEDLKESLTFLLNEPEFKEIMLIEDNGYPEHEKLRDYLQNVWQKDKKFEKLLDQTIEKYIIG